MRVRDKIIIGIIAVILTVVGFIAVNGLLNRMGICGEVSYPVYSAEGVIEAPGNSEVPYYTGE